MNENGLSLLLVVLMVGAIIVPLVVAGKLWGMWWNARQARLRWAIVHTNLLTVLVLAGLVMLYMSIDGLANIRPEVSANAPLLSLITALLPPIFSMVIAIPFIIGAVGLSAVIAYYTAQPIVQHIERLAGDMDTFRGGDHSIRSTVAGQEEITRLQTGFNAMAAELQKTLSALKQERDSMGRLLETRRELFAEVSHELRTPAATLRGYLDSALMNWSSEPPASLRGDLEIISHEVDRLQRLIDDLFLLARAEVGKLTLHAAPTDVGALVRQAVQTVALLAWERGKVRVAADVEDLPFATADSARLEQVLQNLLQNAIRHTPPGGIVAVVGRQETENRSIRLEIRDTGEGISADDLSHIWERFYRGKGQTGSAGIGLALVSELTHAMGGRISVESDLGKGSCFTIWLRTAE